MRFAENFVNSYVVIATANRNLLKGLSNAVTINT